MASLNQDIAQLLAQVEALQRTVEAGSSRFIDNPAALLEAFGVKPYDWQTEALTTRARRVIVNCSRQAGKTTVCGAKALHVCMLGAVTVLLVSPSGRQSGNLYLRMLKVFRAAGAPLGTTMLRADEVRFVNGSRIVALPANADTVRGYTPDLVILDEAARVTDTLYHSLRPALAASGGALWAASTPAGRRGWFYDAWTTGPSYGPDKATGWLKLQATADDLPHLSPDEIEMDRMTMGDAMVRQEYFAEFLDGAGGIFRPEDVFHFLQGSDIESPFQQEDRFNWLDPSVGLLS